MSQVRRIEVGFTKKDLDSVAISAENEISEDLEIKTPLKIRYADVYYLNTDLPDAAVHEVAQKVIIDPLVQIYSVDENLFEGDFYIEVALQEGVTDNLAIVTGEAIDDFKNNAISGKIKTSKKYYFTGKTDKSTIQKIATELLANEIIEKYEIGGMK